MDELRAQVSALRWEHRGFSHGNTYLEGAMSSLIRRAVVAFSLRSRARKAELVKVFIERNGTRTVAVVGGIGSGTQENEGIVEKAVSDVATIVAMLDIELPMLPPFPCLIGDGRSLPWRDQSVDLVIANAVIEHVGDLADQSAFVAEHIRVGRTWVITTPNRWFPVESHTSAVFRHWSSKWRSQRTEFTRLLSLAEFRRLLPPDTVVVGHWWSASFSAFSN